MSAPSLRTLPTLSYSAAPAGSGTPSTPKTPHIPFPAPVYRKPMFEDISREEFLAFQSTAYGPMYDCDPDSYYTIRTPSVWLIRFTIMFLILLYAGWSVWLYYYTNTVVWPLPRRSLNATNGLIHRLTILTRVLIALLGFVSLLAPLLFFMRTRVPGRLRKIGAFSSWIAASFVLLVLPLVMYYIFLCSTQAVAYHESCNAGEEITAFFVGSPTGINANDTRATLFRSSNLTHPIATYVLARTGAGTADFRPMGGELDYFRVSYNISDDQESMSATTHLSMDDLGSMAAVGNLNYMSISPLNATLRGVGEVLEHPVNFRLVDNPPVLDNGTVQGLGTIGRDVVLRSLATHPLKCNKLKLCAKSIDDPVMRAKVLIPMGWALYKHAEYSFSC